METKSDSIKEESLFRKLQLELPQNDDGKYGNLTKIIGRCPFNFSKGFFSSNLSTLLSISQDRSSYFTNYYKTKVTTPYVPLQTICYLDIAVAGWEIGKNQIRWLTEAEVVFFRALITG